MTAFPTSFRLIDVCSSDATEKSENRTAVLPTLPCYRLIIAQTRCKIKRFFRVFSNSCLLHRRKRRENSFFVRFFSPVFCKKRNRIMYKYTIRQTELTPDAPIRNIPPSYPVQRPFPPPGAPPLLHKRGLRPPPTTRETPR